MLLNTTDLIYKPKRIISLVPSQTELLSALGLDHETVGITKFCIHPYQWFKTKTIIGGTKTLNIDKIRWLKPDLVIANREENIKEHVELLANDYPVWVTNVNDLPGALNMIADIGQLTGKTTLAKDLISQIGSAFKPLAVNKKTAKTAYLIWQNPYMTVGGGTFIHDMLEKCGFENIFAGKSRYPEIKIEDLQDAHCQLLLLSTEPYPFKQVHINELQKKLPHTKIILVDGEMFSWYGSRLLRSATYFNRLAVQFLIN